MTATAAIGVLLVLGYGILILVAAGLCGLNSRKEYEKED